MRDAFAAVLDGGASDLEVGALMTASTALEAPRAAHWFAEIILGLSDAIRDRLTPLFADASSAFCPPRHAGRPSVSSLKKALHFCR